MFSIVPVIVLIGFVVVFGMIIATAVRGARQHRVNNQSPVLTVEAKVVTKRVNVSRHHHSSVNDSMPHTSSSTDYYVTFEVESGDRLEFLLPGHEYGMLVEGDRGRLTFQGTRYKGFERIRA